MCFADSFALTESENRISYAHELHVQNFVSVNVNQRTITPVTGLRSAFFYAFIACFRVFGGFMSQISLKTSLIKMGSALFLSYMSVALALPVVSVYTDKELGFSNLLGGIAVGIAFVSTIFSRKYAGRFADTVSSKKCTMIGLGLYAASAVICLLSTASVFPLWLSFAVLLLGRLILGIGESMTMVGFCSWHFSIIGNQHSGRILAVVGMAMYGSFAAGGPIGLALYNRFGFNAVMYASMILPFIGFLMLRNNPAAAVHKTSQPREPFFRVIYMIWKHGAVVCMQGVGFAVIGAFISLYFTNMGWSHAGLGLTCFGAGFVVVRIFCGGLPDKIGGVRVAMVSLFVETAGQAALWLAPDAGFALAGALLTGIGCSMVFPSMGVEAIKRVPAHLRATALGGFAAFQDIAYAFSAPLAGILADSLGYRSVFMLGTVMAALGILTVVSMNMENR